MGRSGHHGLDSYKAARTNNDSATGYLTQAQQKCKSSGAEGAAICSCNVDSLGPERYRTTATGCTTCTMSGTSQTLLRIVLNYNEAPCCDQLPFGPSDESSRFRERPHSPVHELS